MPERFNAPKAPADPVPRAYSVGLAVWLLVVVMAGCVDGGDEPRSLDESSPGPSDARGGGDASAPAGANTTESAGLQLVLLECTGFVALLDTAPPAFEPDYPAGVSGTHSVLVFPAFVLYDCAQAVLPDHVKDGFQFAFLTTLIDPVEGMPGGYTPGFLHQVYASDAAFAADVSARYGLDVVPMERTVVSWQDLASGYRSVAFDVPPDDPAYSVDAVLFAANREADRNDILVYEAPDGLAYLTDEFSGGFGNGATTVRFGPGSYWAEHGAAPAWSGTIAYRPDMTTTIGFGGTL